MQITERVSRGKSKGIANLIMLGVGVVILVVMATVALDQVGAVGFGSGQTGANWSAPTRSIWQNVFGIAIIGLVIMLLFAGLRAR